MQTANKYQNCVRATAMCLFVLAACNIVPAQQTMTSATLSGRVEDSSGAVIKTASVVAKKIDTGQEQTTTSDDDGRFRFPYLPVGTYEISVEASGFARLTRQLTLSVGQALDLPLKLAVGNIQENVNVTADLPVIETVRTQVAETLLPREIDSLPLNGRNYLDLAALTPAVTRTNPVANQRFPETSAVPGTGLSITGQRFINNGFVVDGMSANDDAADLPGTFFSQEVVREFEVITSGGIAEFGRASGGFVNIVTQSGTNNFHGRLYGFLRNQRLDARNPLAPSQRSADPSPVWSQCRRAHRPEPHFFLFEFRADEAAQRRRSHNLAGERRRGEQQARLYQLQRTTNFDRRRAHWLQHD